MLSRHQEGNIIILGVKPEKSSQKCWHLNWVLRDEQSFAESS